MVHPPYINGHCISAGRFPTVWVGFKSNGMPMCWVVDEPVPEVVVAVLGAAEVRARAGHAATLACEARYEPPPRDLPLPALDIRWQRGEQPVSLQVSVCAPHPHTHPHGQC